MNHPTILRIIEHEIIPEAVESGSSIEEVILKKASAFNWSPAQTERVAEVANRVSSLSYPEQHPDNPGGQFPVINAKELAEKYASINPDSGSQTVTVIDSPSLGRSFASFADLQNDNTVQEYTIRRAAEKLAAAKETQKEEFPVLPAQDQKAAFVETKKLLRQVCNEAGASLESIENEVRPYAGKLASVFPQLEADMSLYPVDDVMTAVEDIKLACKHLKHVVVEMGYTMEEQPFKRASSRYYDTTGFVPLVLRTIDHLKAAHNSFETASTLVRTLNEEVFGPKLAAAIEQEAFVKAAEKEKQREEDDTEYEESYERFDPYGESRHLMSRSGQLGDALYQVLGESLTPLESYATGVMNGNRGVPASQMVRQNLDLFRDVLGTEDYISRKARREAEAKSDVDSVTTLLGLQTGDPVLSKRDPQRVQDIFNALRRYNPDMMSDPETARAILQDTTAYDKVTPMHMEELLKLRKLQGEINRLDADSADRRYRKPQ